MKGFDVGRVSIWPSKEVEQQKREGGKPYGTCRQEEEKAANIGRALSGHGYFLAETSERPELYSKDEIIVDSL